jgi:hypothetical protein
MAKKHTLSDPRNKMSPLNTVAHLTDEFINDLQLPELPGGIPDRLSNAVRERVNAHLFRLKEAKQVQWHKPFEVRLVRDAHRIVLTAYELGMPEAEAYYATFRQLAEDLGYRRADVGYQRRED